MISQRDKSYSEKRREWKREQELLRLHEERKQERIRKFEEERMSQRRESDRRPRRSSRDDDRRSQFRTPPVVGNVITSGTDLQPPENNSDIEPIVMEFIAKMKAVTSQQSEDRRSQTRKGDQRSPNGDQGQRRNVIKTESRRPTSSHDTRDPQPSTSGTQHFTEPSHRSSRKRTRSPSNDRYRSGSRHHHRSGSCHHHRSRSNDRHRSRSRHRSHCRECSGRHSGPCPGPSGHTYNSPRSSGNNLSGRRHNFSRHENRTESERIDIWLPGGHIIETQKDGSLHVWWRSYTRWGRSAGHPPIHLPFPPFDFKTGRPPTNGPIHLEDGNLWYPAQPPLPPYGPPYPPRGPPPGPPPGYF